MAMTREERANAVLTGGGTTVAVTFANAFKAATTPDVGIRNIPRNVSWWLTNISNTGFTLNVGSSAGTADETWRYIASGVDQ